MDWLETGAPERFLVGRQYLHTLFHKAFGGHPSVELLQALLSDETLAVARWYAENPTMNGLARFLEGMRECDMEELLSAAEAEFTRTFNGTMMLPAYPFESPYLTGAAEMFQPSTSEVRAIYRTAGLQAKAQFDVPDDHISLMCAFLAYETRAMWGAWRAEATSRFGQLAQQQAAFLRGHMATWVDDYARQTRASSHPVLYPQLIEAMAAFVQLDLAFMDTCAAFEGPMAGEDDALSTRLSTVLAALASLESIRLPGLEDYELERISG